MRILGTWIWSGNTFEGFVPTEVGLLQHLWSLALEYNKLWEIPSEIGLVSSPELSLLRTTPSRGPSPQSFPA
jgi:hypothetical protein